MDAEEMYERLLDKNDNLLLTNERLKSNLREVKEQLHTANKKYDELCLKIKTQEMAKE